MTENDTVVISRAKKSLWNRREIILISGKRSPVLSKLKINLKQFWLIWLIFVQYCKLKNRTELYILVAGRSFSDLYRSLLDFHWFSSLRRSFLLRNRKLTVNVNTRRKPETILLQLKTKACIRLLCQITYNNVQIELAKVSSKDKRNRVDSSGRANIEILEKSKTLINFYSLESVSHLASLLTFSFDVLRTVRAFFARRSNGDKRCGSSLPVFTGSTAISSPCHKTYK